MAFLRSFVEDEEIYDPPPVTDNYGDFPVIDQDPAPAPVTESSGGGNGRGAGPANPGLSARPRFNFGPVPQFTPPQFRRPTFEDARNEPGFEFRLKGGSDALERSAAARGVLRTGGTLKDLVEYGQNFASQEYGNVFNRALQEYDRQYRGAHDAFAPSLAEYQLRGNAETAAGLAGFDREWQQYVFNNTPRGGGKDDPYDPEPEPPDVTGF